MAESEQADLRQGNTKPSVATLRGHQTPAAFLMMVSFHLFTQSRVRIVTDISVIYNLKLKTTPN